MADNIPSPADGDTARAAQPASVNPEPANQAPENLDLADVALPGHALENLEPWLGSTDAAQLPLQPGLDNDEEEDGVPRRVPPPLAFIVSMVLLVTVLWGPMVLMFANETLYHNCMTSAAAQSTTQPSARQSLLYDSIHDQVLRRVTATIHEKDGQRPTVLAATYVRAPDLEQKPKNVWDRGLSAFDRGIMHRVSSYQSWRSQHPFNSEATNTFPARKEDIRAEKQKWIQETPPPESKTGGGTLVRESKQREADKTVSARNGRYNTLASPNGLNGLGYRLRSKLSVFFAPLITPSSPQQKLPSMTEESTQNSPKSPCSFTDQTRVSAPKTTSKTNLAVSKKGDTQDELATESHKPGQETSISPAGFEISPTKSLDGHAAWWATQRLNGRPGHPATAKFGGKTTKSKVKSVKESSAVSVEKVKSKSKKPIERNGAVPKGPVKKISVSTKSSSRKESPSSTESVPTKSKSFNDTLSKEQNHSGRTTKPDKWEAPSTSTITESAKAGKPWFTGSWLEKISIIPWYVWSRATQPPMERARMYEDTAENARTHTNVETDSSGSTKDSKVQPSTKEESSTPSWTELTIPPKAWFSGSWLKKISGSLRSIKPKILHAPSELAQINRDLTEERRQSSMTRKNDKAAKDSSKESKVKASTKEMSAVVSTLPAASEIHIVAVFKQALGKMHGQTSNKFSPTKDFDHALKEVHSPASNKFSPSKDIPGSKQEFPTKEEKASNGWRNGVVRPTLKLTKDMPIEYTSTHRWGPDFVEWIKNVISDFLATRNASTPSKPVTSPREDSNWGPEFFGKRRRVREQATEVALELSTSLYSIVDQLMAEGNKHHENITRLQEAWDGISRSEKVIDHQGIVEELAKNGLGRGLLTTYVGVVHKFEYFATDLAAASERIMRSPIVSQADIAFLKKEVRGGLNAFVKQVKKRPHFSYGQELVSDGFHWPILTDCGDKLLRSRRGLKHLVNMKNMQ